MKLSTRAEYGTRALVELAMHHDDPRPMMLQTIADRQGLSKKYLEQLFILLRRAEIIEGLRGPTGGYRLARHPSEIRMAEVIEVLEGSLAVADCLVDQDSCIKSGSCATQEIWGLVSPTLSKRSWVRLRSKNSSRGILVSPITCPFFPDLAAKPFIAPVTNPPKKANKRKRVCLV